MNSSLSEDSPLSVSERIGSLIRQGLNDEALSAMQFYKNRGNPWDRILKHYTAKIDLVNGSYESAAHQFEEIIKNEGPHILIYADIVAAWYMSKQYTKWKLAIGDFERELKKIQEKISEINRWRAQIILAKSMELNGSIYERIRFLINFIVTQIMISELRH